MESLHIPINSSLEWMPRYGIPGSLCGAVWCDGSDGGSGVCVLILFQECVSLDPHQQQDRIASQREWYNLWRCCDSQKHGASATFEQRH